MATPIFGRRGAAAAPEQEIIHLTLSFRDHVFHYSHTFPLRKVCFYFIAGFFFFVVTMPTFVPIYRPTSGYDTFLERRQKQRQTHQSHQDEESSESEDGAQPSSNAERLTETPFIPPLTKTDPYYVAGHSRNLPVPPAPFPHAAVKPVKVSKRPIDEELAKLNPPLFPISHHTDKNSTSSLRRRHLDNLTSILHRSILRGDWNRATHAWSILVRTEIGGLGMDVRRNGRWGIPAELLMRRRQPHTNTPSPREAPVASDMDDTIHPRYGEQEQIDGDEQDDFPFSETGLEQAKDYYERLIVQNPHTPHTQHRFNATQVYPALFNIWIYQVQSRSQRALRLRRRRRQKESSSKREISSDDNSSHSQSDLYSGSDAYEISHESTNHQSESAEQQQRFREIRLRELNDALPIAQRLEMLCLSPPCDTHVELLRLSVMVEIWISDLYDFLAKLDKLSASEESDPDKISVGYDAMNVTENEEHRRKAREGRSKAKRLCEQLARIGGEIPTAGREVNNADSL